MRRTERGVPATRLLCGPAVVVLAAVLVLGGCGESKPTGVMPLEQVQVSLVTVPSAREVLVENEAHPVRAWTLQTSSIRHLDTSPLPALEMVPPARVRIDLGPVPPGSHLRLALGLDASAHEGESSGRVGFEVASGGRKLHGVELPFGSGVPGPQRVWNRAELSLDGVTELELSTTLVEGEGAPRAGIASLEIVTSSERPRETVTEEKPNIVLIVVDTLRYDRLSCYGYGRELSPSIDALAERGVRFEAAYATSPWTWPSTASILTSLDPAQHGVLSYEACYLSQSLLTIAELVQSEGWTTGAFSSNPLIHASKDFDQGFETFREYQWAPASKLIGEAASWLDAYSSWRFFLYLHLTDPHDYKPVPAHAARWVGEPPEGYANGAGSQELKAKVLGEEYDAELLAARTAHHSTIYDATVAQTDAAIGQLVAKLDELGLTENTVIALTSDHGEEFLDHGNCFHGSQLHRELIGVPLILSGPGVPRGRIVTERVENRFLAPTLVRLAGLEDRENIAGLNLLDPREVTQGAERPFFTTTSQGVWFRTPGAPWLNMDIHGVMLGQELFFWVPEGGNGASAYALFDLASDPEARVDLSADRPERAEQLVDRIQRWLERGLEVRPTVLDGGESALELMQQMGYVR